jgi:hypothetical protein
LDEPTLARALATIRDRTSISAVSEFLRAKEVQHSAGSWDDLIEKRLRPALDSGALDDNDVRTLVREAEDFGRQHVFLFEPTSSGPDPATLLKPERIKRFLKTQGWDGLVDSFSIPVMPSDIEAVDVHFDGTYVSFKFVERRSIVLLERQETSEGYTVRRVEQHVRAVNLVRLYENGLLEFRIASIAGTLDYAKLVARFWLEVQELIARMGFREKDLSRLRKSFTVKASAATQKIVRVRRAKGQDTDGTRFELMMHRPDGDLLNSSSVAQGIAALAASNTTRLGHTSVVFLPQASGNLRREVGVIFADGINELRVLPSCTQREYDYIRGQIERHSK